MTAKTLRNKGCFRTAKTPRNKWSIDYTRRVRIDCTRGVSREQRATIRRNKSTSPLISNGSGHTKGYNMNIKRYFKLRDAEAAMLDAELKRRAIEEVQFNRFPDRVVSSINFEEKSFGNSDPSCQNNYRSANNAQDLSSIVVSLALFDGDKMLYACSGIPIPDGQSKLRLSRFVTSANLVQNFNCHRNRDDKLRVEVRLPDGSTTDGFLGLFDVDIAIVTSLGFLGVKPVDLDLDAPPIAPEDSVIAAGRVFKTGSLMTMNVSATGSNYTVSDSPNFSEAVLGGPLVEVKNPSDGNGMRFLGMNLRRYSPDDANVTPDNANVRYSFLSRDVLRQRLTLFRILEARMASMKECFVSLPEHIEHHAGKNQLAAMEEPNWLTRPSEHLVARATAARRGKANAYRNPAAPESARSFCKELHFREYSLPNGVFNIIPSGFVHTINRIESLGYPKPPPLVLEFNGQLLNRFEGYFGRVRAWTGFPYGDPPAGSGEHVWERLSKEVVTDISRRVVSLASFKGHSRFFACTGLLIKWHARTLILTSASLVRGHDGLTIDNGLRIEVSLPPNQRANGTLELYNLSSNYAIVSIEKNFHSVRPEDIFNKKLKSPKKVVAVGRDATLGLLMASMGEVKPGNSEYTMLSTCIINKAGIGGPLIDFSGSFVGMNFYNGSKLTPVLPKSKIVEALRRVKKFVLQSERGLYPSMDLETSPMGMDLNGRMEIGDDGPMGMDFDGPMEIDDNGALVLQHPKELDIARWNVPKPYWCHGGLDVHRYHVPMLIGRTLN